MIFRRRRRRTVLRPEFPALSVGQVIYAIGDIHGRCDLLDKLLWRMDWDQRNHGGEAFEVYLGDYVDRGPDSAAVIGRLIERARSKRIICLKGNHEVLFEEFLDGKLDLQTWSRLGGLETLKSYRVDPGALAALSRQARAQSVRAQIPDDHLSFLGSSRHSFHFGDYFFAHAGVRPGVPLEQQSPSDLRAIRGAFLDDERDHGAVVVHGHTPCEAPEVFLNRINIDTGAYMTDRLTCLVIDHLGPQLLENRS